LADDGGWWDYSGTTISINLRNLTYTAGQAFPCPVKAEQTEASQVSDSSLDLGHGRNVSGLYGHLTLVLQAMAEIKLLAH
jgi:hypothetical protein